MLIFTLAFLNTNNKVLFSISTFCMYQTFINEGRLITPERYHYASISCYEKEAKMSKNYTVYASKRFLYGWLVSRITVFTSLVKMIKQIENTEVFR